MNRILLLSLLAGVLVSALMVSSSCGAGRGAQVPDTLKINTTYLGADVAGFNGPTPVEISMVKGVITRIEALPNQETPRFFQMVKDSLLTRLVGKTVEEAKALEPDVDAVSGATYSSNAVIRNIRRGLESVTAK